MTSVRMSLYEGMFRVVISSVWRCDKLGLWDLTSDAWGCKKVGFWVRVMIVSALSCKSSYPINSYSIFGPDMMPADSRRSQGGGVEARTKVLDGDALGTLQDGPDMKKHGGVCDRVLANYQYWVPYS